MVTAVNLGTIGLQADVQVIIRAVCTLSRSRATQYYMAVEKPNEPVGIVVVDADNHEAYTTWQRFNISYPNVPSVLISKEDHDYEIPIVFSVKRNGLGTRLLTLLDRATQQIRSGTSQPIHGQTSSHQSPQTQNQYRSSEADMGNAQNTINSVEQLSGKSVINQPIALVVDDSLSVRTQMKIFLNRQNLVVHLAENAEIGLQMVKQQRYNIIFLDVVLPEMDGYKACKLIKREKLASKVPIIMLTSKKSAFNRVRGVMAGCDVYLTKPVDARKLVKIIDKNII